MNEIFILIRLPVFLLGVVAATMWFIGVGILFLPLMLVLAPLLFVVVLPFRFVWAALTNDAAGFSRHIRASIDEWKKTLVDGLSEPEKTYKGLFRWLAGN